MQEDTGATITIDEADGVGKVQVSAPNKDAIDAALGKIKAIVAIPEVVLFALSCLTAAS